ncbi:WD repeat-containing protein 97 [Myxocyprinus asiaticus]|uniref:WD repeat-containing protein 97 n=1 Tax=Myxocyprinus asiaticus TaxID=70543 RepID=UPI0022220C97|nr:WD repeat-containing protein 97 [Myxocyprinus asiaticus]
MRGTVDVLTHPSESRGVTKTESARVECPAGKDRREKSCQMWKESVDKMSYDDKPSIVSHGLYHVLHLSCEDTVCHMTCCEGAAGFASLHSSGNVQFYHPDGHLRDPTFCPSLTIHYAGITSTQLPGRLVGWGPGAILTLVDTELKPLVHAVEPMDVRVCKVLEHSNELVTAGMGNVCVWCLTHLLCRTRVVEGLGKHIVPTQLALVPNRAHQGPRVLAAYGGAVVVVDLTDGCIMEHKKNLHLREITGLVYCPIREIVGTASDTTIRVWGPDWELQMAFVGHTALVTSLVLCPVSGLLFSSSLDGTLRSWRLEVGDQLQTISIPNGYASPLAMGGPDSAGMFFSYSTNSVDFWTFNCLYNLHCSLGGALGGPVRQILAPPNPPSFPAFVLCIHGNSGVTVVVAQTGAVLTRFKAKQRVRCADYCVPKEILLVLTEDGVVTTASTLTNPVTILDKWDGIEQWEWKNGKVEANIGKVSCMVLYNHITDTQSAQEEWKTMQMQRPQRPKKIKLLHDVKNRFLVILGHCGGCVSVLNVCSGKVQYRTPAHNNQDITSIQAYPDSGYLLTAGKDEAVLVWRVFPSAQHCLSLHFSVFCDLPPLLMALMGTQLTLALQEPENYTYSLVQYNLEKQSRYDHPFKEDPYIKITGLCACPQLSVFALSSQNGTVQIWDKENQLLSILELNIEPECLAYCEESGGLLLGITGDLYRIPCAQLLPQDSRLQKCKKDSELPKSWIPTKSHKCRAESCKGAEEDSPDRLERKKDPDIGALMAKHKDLESLQKGAVECRRRKTATVQTKQEAFNQYMRLIYRQPPDRNIPEEDMFDVYAELFPPQLPELHPLTPPSFTEGFFPNHSLAKRHNSPNKQVPLGFIPNSVVVGQLWPDIKVENVIPTKCWRLCHDLGHDIGESKPDDMQLLYNEEEEEEEPKMQNLTPIIKTPPEKESPVPPAPVSEKVIYPFRAPKPLPPIKRPTPPLAPPSPASSSPTPAPPSPSPPKQPPQSPSKHLPEFLLPFMDELWFQKMFPDLSSISGSLSPKEFCMHLLDFMACCSMAEKHSILNALLMLVQQEVLDKESLSKGLLVCLQNSIHKNMSLEEQHLVGDLLNLMLYLSPDSSDTIVELLAVLADKEVDLQGLVLCVLQRLGVDEAELWLCPELEPWNSLTKNQPDQHHSLRDMAFHWLLTWTGKYKVHSGSVFLQGERIKSVITPVEVLKYFCSVQRGKQARPAPPPPEGRKDTVLVPSSLNRLKPIQRLGETYSMSRIREPQGLLMPPLPYQPLLMGFTRFLSLPMAHVTLSSFPLSLDYRNFKKNPPHRYFFLEHSYVQFYR